MEPSPASRPHLIGVPAFLIFLVFALSGTSIALFSFAFGYNLDSLVTDESLPAITRVLSLMPAGLWIACFALIGVMVGWWFQKLENRDGEVSRRAAGMAAILGLTLVLFILVGLALPFLQGKGVG